MTTIPAPTTTALAAASMRGLATLHARAAAADNDEHHASLAQTWNHDADTWRAVALLRVRELVTSTPLQTFHLGASIVQEVVAFHGGDHVEWVDQYGTTHLAPTALVTLAGITQ